MRFEARMADPPQACSDSSSVSLFFLPKSHLGNVLVDMKLIDIKDTLPVGFIPIQETVDTRESPSGPTHHSESFLPPGVCVDIFMCSLLQKHFRRAYCMPTNKPCCFWHMSDLALLWHVLGRGVEVSRTHPFLWEWGSLLNQFTWETSCSLSLAHLPVMLKPSFAQDPEAKGQKPKRRSGNTSALIPPLLVLGV